jgi:hypothetical protein
MNPAQSKNYIRHSIFSFVYLLILLLYLTRPAFPYLEYLLFKDYISKNLCINKDIPDNCCHGKCYLDEQLKKAIEPIDTDRNSNTKIFRDKKVEDHLLARTTLSKPAVERILYNSFYSERIIDSFLTPAFVPPKLSLIS